jgi:hypothetical protein
MAKITIKRGNSVGAHKDYYVVQGGRASWKPVLVMSKTRAQEIANARRRLVSKRQL